MQEKFTENGLTEIQVEQSRKKHGSNALTQKKRGSFLKKFLESFGDPMIKVLLVALGINIIVMFRSFDWYEPLGIALSILIATLISTLSEYGSEAAFEKLQADCAKIKCKVRRNGQIEEISIEEIVVGDTVILQTGDKIPADGLVTSGTIHVDQSSLNGETKEAEKRAISLNAKFSEDILSKQNLFRGTVVCQGECEMTVCKVGDNTFYGQMAKEVQQETRKSPLNIRLTQLAGTISKIGYTGAALVAVAYIFQVLWIDFNFNLPAMAAHYSDFTTLITDILNLITLVVTVIVVAVPEGLPMMITVVLSANIKKMLKDNVLVRKMTGIETAGNLNILFTDKTGTLTRGKLSVHTVLTGMGEIHNDPIQVKKNKEYYKLLCAALFFNNSSSLTKDKGMMHAIGGNATDRAVLEYIKNDSKICAKIHRSSFTPFSSASKFSKAKVSGEINATFIKGSPDLLLPKCKYYYDKNGEKVPCTNFSNVKYGMKKLTDKAIRLLAVAQGEGDELTLICILGLRDDLRKETPASVRQMKKAGIQVVMITGDSKETATAIAKECGVLSASSDLVLTSAELNKMTDEDISRQLAKIKVIARALPTDKSRLVRISQNTGKVVGMTGDGVNDAPALKAADVGFAMGSGTEVAKEASDIVILDDNIKSIGSAVLYGRTIFKSIRKFIIYQLAINLSAMGLSIIGPILGIETPITVMQMLWVNLVMDTLAGLAFSGECAKLSYMSEKPKKRNEKILNKYMISSILWTGSYSLIISLLFYKIPAFNSFIRYDSEGKYMLTAFFALFMFMSIFNSFNARTHTTNLISYLSRNKPFIIIIGFVFIAQTLMIYLGGDLFRTAGLTAGELTKIILISATIIPFDLLRKKILKRLGKLNGV